MKKKVSWGSRGNSGSRSVVEGLKTYVALNINFELHSNLIMMHVFKVKHESLHQTVTEEHGLVQSGEVAFM